MPSTRPTTWTLRRAMAFIPIAAGVFTTLIAWYAASAVEEPPKPGPVLGAVPDRYGVLTSHLCTDLEYLVCLQITSDRCRRDLQEPEVTACGRRPYIMTDAPGLTPGAVVPPEMVECVYTAHVELLRLDPADVDRCMSEAKLR